MSKRLAFLGESAPGSMVIAKRRQSLYEPGRRSPAWVKVKFNRRQEFVVGGFKPNGTDLESLVIGYYEGRTLHFAGRVRAGLTARDRAALFRRIAGDQVPDVPLQTCPVSGAAIGAKGSQPRT
jgi:bifunctional non-homologous end joining protein LigD